MAVVDKLVDAGIDLIEISGGTYEAPVMTGAKLKESTRQREAYFLRVRREGARGSAFRWS